MFHLCAAMYAMRGLLHSDRNGLFVLSVALLHKISWKLWKLRIARVASTNRHIVLTCIAAD